MNRLLCTLAKNVVNNGENNIKLLPRLAVFDLDHTIWPFGIDNYYFIPPYFYDTEQKSVVDICGKQIKHFPDYPLIFESLKSHQMKIAVASRTKFPTGAYRLIKLFELNKYIDYYHIYPGQKFKHFERIKEESGIDFEEMIFFDDEQRNISDIQSLGVQSILVDHEFGATKAIVDETLKNFRNSRKKM